MLFLVSRILRTQQSYVPGSRLSSSGFDHIFDSRAAMVGSFHISIVILDIGQRQVILYGLLRPAERCHVPLTPAEQSDSIVYKIRGDLLLGQRIQRHELLLLGFAHVRVVGVIDEPVVEGDPGLYWNRLISHRRMCPR